LLIEQSANKSAIENRHSAILQVRLFIGVELDDEVKARAAAIGDELREKLGRRVTARWIPPANLHITLWFIGEVADDRAATIIDAVRTPFATRSFALELRGAGAFPPHGAPRVFWIGVARGQDSLGALYNELAARLKRLGFEPERRPYSAHLTIARVKAPSTRVARPGRAREGRNVLRDFAADAGRCRINAVTVFRSRLSPKGATYEPLVRVPLEGSA
jgi:2'-5' RNA ligase